MSDQCKHAVYTPYAFSGRRCVRKARPGSRWCWQHDPKVEEERQRKSAEYYNAKMSRELKPLVLRDRYRTALQRITRVRSLAKAKDIARKALK